MMSILINMPKHLHLIHSFKNAECIAISDAPSELQLQTTIPISLLLKLLMNSSHIFIIFIFHYVYWGGIY